MGIFDKWGVDTQTGAMPMDAPKWGVDVATGAMPGLGQAMKPKKRGIFGSGIRWQDVLGSVGDALTGNPVYGHSQMQQRQSLMDAERERQKLEEKQYEPREVGGNLVRLNPQSGQYDTIYSAPTKPANNDTINDFNWYSGLSDEQRKLYHQMKPTIAFRADGTPISVNPYDLRGNGQQATGPQVGQVEDGYRFKGGNPADPNAWEKVGGAASNGGGNFPS